MDAELKFAETLEAHLAFLQKFIFSIPSGLALHKIIVDKNQKPVDYVFVEINGAFEKLTGLQREAVVGKRVTEVLPGVEKDPADWIGVYGQVALTGESTSFDQFSEAIQRWFRIVATCPEPGYFMVIFEDITDRKNDEAEREELVGELQTALAEISTLRGIVPLCSYCKKVRDDDGYWEQVETYIAQKTEAQVSHGICPGCLKENHPEEFELLYPNGIVKPDSGE